MKSAGVIILVFFIVLSQSLISCGPMNEAPSSGSQAAQLPVSGQVNLTKNSLFYVLISLNGGARLGENTCLVRFAHSDLEVPSHAARLTMTYWMPDMPGMGVSEASSERGADGSFTARLFLSMRGRWEATLHIQDGLKQDDYVFEVTI